MPTHRDYAAFSEDVYYSASVRLPSDWQSYLNADTYDLSHNGFYARAYRNTAFTQVVVAFRGTDDLDDFTDSNFMLALGEIPAQFTYLSAFMERVSASLASGARIVGFTGHSLGGFLAQLAAAKYNIPAVAFDSPGVNEVIRNSLVTSTSPFEHSSQLRSLATCYNAAPNLVNIASGQQLCQVYRLYPEYDLSAFFFTRQQHAMSKIYQQFSPSTGEARVKSDMTAYWTINQASYSWPFYVIPYGTGTWGGLAHLPAMNSFLNREFFDNYAQNPYYWEQVWSRSMYSTALRQIQIMSKGGLGIINTRSGVTIKGDDGENIIFGGTNFKDNLLGYGGDDHYYPFSGDNVIVDSAGEDVYHIYTHNMVGVTTITDQDDRGNIYIENFGCSLKKAEIVTHAAFTVTVPLYVFFPSLDSRCKAPKFTSWSLGDASAAVFFSRANSDLAISYAQPDLQANPKRQVWVKDYKSSKLNIELVGSVRNQTLVPLWHQANDFVFERPSWQYSWPVVKSNTLLRFWFDYPSPYHTYVVHYKLFNEKNEFQHSASFLIGGERSNVYALSTATSHLHDSFAIVYLTHDIPGFSKNAAGACIASGRFSDIVSTKVIFSSSLSIPRKTDLTGNSFHFVRVATTTDSAFVIASLLDDFRNYEDQECAIANHDGPVIRYKGTYGQFIGNSGIKSQLIKIFDSDARPYIQLSSFLNNGYVLLYKDFASGELRVRYYPKNVDAYQELNIIHSPKIFWMDFRDDGGFEFDSLPNAFAVNRYLAADNKYEELYCNLHSGCSDSKNKIDYDSGGGLRLLLRRSTATIVLENTLYWFNRHSPGGSRTYFDITKYDWLDKQQQFIISDSYLIEIPDIGDDNHLYNFAVTYFKEGFLFNYVVATNRAAPSNEPLIEGYRSLYVKIPLNTEKQIKIGSERDDYISCGKYGESILAGLGGNNVYCLNTRYKCTVIAEPSSSNTITRDCGDRARGRLLLDEDTPENGEVEVYGYNPETDLIDLGSSNSGFAPLSYSLNSSLENGTLISSAQIYLYGGGLLRLVGVSNFTSTYNGSTFHFTNGRLNQTVDLLEVADINYTQIVGNYNHSRRAIYFGGESTSAFNLEDLAANETRLAVISPTPSPTSSYTPTLFANSSLTPAISLNPTTRENNNNPLLMIIIGSAAGGGALLILISLIVIACCCRKRPKPSHSTAVLRTEPRPVSPRIDVGAVTIIDGSNPMHASP